MTAVNRVLTARDFSTLSHLVEEWHAAGYALARTARKVLDDATVVFPSDLPPDVASLGSRLEYSDAGGKRRVVELTALSFSDHDHLPVHLPLGLAVLGRREGDAIDVRQDDETLQRVRLERVLKHPERSRPGGLKADASRASRPSTSQTEEGQ